ncbi:LacI family DNA-binding transcriptional regulator [Pedobacter sp. MC2016-24]|uniref:LacI family DNA-binding transcriptional regulator n=1 Tax=Pedobacter sp. MC2016-24 TaxID=2780090 RepID=UPI00187FCBFF|nr:substrate-binding domain-containing protein [Pedobacter sp. MC2016-24]MBE9601529.1 substrate-binding domain-containing protein [Pedobacter sp. MC2016-24]
MAKRLSIRDIANELQISKTTISFILNGKAKEKRISDELAEKVMKHVAQRAYKPNQLAKSLSTGKTMMIGLMVENISDYFFAQVAYHIEELAYQHGYRIIYCSTDNDLHKTQELISMFRERHVDGYIITAPAGLEKDVQGLLDDGLPVVLFDRYLKGVDTSYVILDNYKASYDATKYLTDQGFENIAFVELDSDQSQMHDRREGYLQAVADAHLAPLIKKIPFTSDFDQKVKELVKFIRKSEDVDAIFFATNYLAFSGIKALNQLKMHTPQDVAIVAFDDHEVFNIYSPTVTAVAQPIKKLAQQSINALLKMLDAKDGTQTLEKIEVAAELIIRDSTKV